MSRYLAVGEMPQISEAEFRDALDAVKKWRIDRQSWVIKAYCNLERGKLVIESSLEQLTARVGGAVRVRTPEPARLVDALKQAGIEATSSNDHALIVHGTTSDRVGDIAFTAGVPVHELVAEGSSLEEVFLDLTSELQP